MNINYFRCPVCRKRRHMREYVNPYYSGTLHGCCMTCAVAAKLKVQANDRLARTVQATLKQIAEVQP